MSLEMLAKHGSGPSFEPLRLLHGLDQGEGVRSILLFPFLYPSSSLPLPTPRFKPEAVMSTKASRPGIGAFLFSRDVLGVKKRLKRRGVTVGIFLILDAGGGDDIKLEVGGGLEDIGTPGGDDCTGSSIPGDSSRLKSYTAVR
jgi:hypothetical protein